MRFSARIAASEKKPLLFDDAPRPLRIGFIKKILWRFLGHTYNNNIRRTEPLEISDVHEAFVALIREEASPWEFDESGPWAALSEHLKVCKWSEFFDFIELVGAQLIEKDDSIPFDETTHFVDYQTQVNALLTEDGIGWRLNRESQLVRSHPKVMEDGLVAAADALSKRFETARIHYQKASQYLHRHPLDEANSIKEIVSAVESVARTLEPRASTLGDAIKYFKRDVRFPSGLLDPLEKLYAYSNSTALVRHGHVDSGKPSIIDAELALFVGVAYIRYFIAISEGANV